MAGDVMEQISTCLQNKKNFLLSGGAGSGKTYTLVQTLHKVYENDLSARVACITYTNVAANEIKSRSPYSKLWVSTIHDFLWNVIKGFQKNLVIAVKELIKSNEISYSGEIFPDQFLFTTVEYLNYRRLEDGIISHDDLLKVAEYMFAHYPLLSKILCDKFEFIFIDEYQDTQQAVINIFLEHVANTASGRTCLGFFGDRMQSIYDSGIVDIQEYVDKGQVLEIKKTDNYRCSQNVIDLLNNLRGDLSQQPAKTNADGTIANKQGSAVFLYSTLEFDLSAFATTSYAAGWNLQDPKETKLLFLTHKLIANRIGYNGILSAYSHNDMLLGDSPDRLALHLLKIGGIVHFFREKKYAPVIDLLDRRIKTIKDKKMISTSLNRIALDLTARIGDVIDTLDTNGLVKKDDRFSEYVENDADKYDIIKNLPLSEVLAYYSYYNGYSPYSTQHGIKGAEFENVLVVMDNGRWNKYNFKYLFERTSGKESVIRRTERIFYVCCSRAINNLVVYYPSPSSAVIANAKKWFGGKQCSFSLIKRRTWFSISTESRSTCQNCLCMLSYF